MALGPGARRSGRPMRDVDYDPRAESAYECFTCGTLVIAETNPGECQDCGSDLRNRRTPIE